MNRMVRISVNDKEFPNSLSLQQVISFIEKNRSQISFIKVRWDDETNWVSASNFLTSNNHPKSNPLPPTYNPSDFITINSNRDELKSRSTTIKNPNGAGANKALRALVFAVCGILAVFATLSLILFTYKSSFKREDKYTLKDSKYQDFRDYKDKSDAEGMLIESKSLVKTYPKSAVASRALIDSYIENKEYTNAASELERCFSLNPNDPKTWKKKAFYYYICGLNKEAISSYIRAIELCTNDPSIYINYSTSLLRVGETNKAVENINLAIASIIAPNYFDPEVNKDRINDLIARDLINCNELERAEEWCDLVLKQQPSNNLINFRKAVIACRRGDQLEMDRQLNEYLKSYLSKREYALDLRGSFFYNQKAYQDALNAYQVSLQVNPLNITALKGIAKILYIGGTTNLPLVDSYLNKIATINPEEADDFANYLYGVKPTVADSKLAETEKMIEDPKVLDALYLIHKISRRYEGNLLRYAKRYDSDIAAAGLSKLLSPERISNDPSLNESFQILDNLNSIVQKYKVLSQGEPSKVIKSAENLPIPFQYKKQYIDEIKSTLSNKSLSPDQRYEYESLVLNEFYELFRDLKNERGRWIVKYGKLYFDDDMGLNNYNKHLESISKIYSDIKSSNNSSRN